MYEAFLEFPEGWGGVKKNPFHGRGTCMDIFWKYTMGAAIFRQAVPSGEPLVFVDSPLRAHSPLRLFLPNQKTEPPSYAGWS